LNLKWESVLKRDICDHLLLEHAESAIEINVTTVPASLQRLLSAFFGE
jgi:hypothetical protein